MDGLFQLALTSQTICGGIQLLLFSISLGVVVGALQHYHANDRLTFNCSPKPSDFTKQLCYDKYTSTVSSWLIPRNVAVITYTTVFACWICFMLYGAVTLRQIKREQAEENCRRRKLTKFLRMYFVHVCFRLVFLGVMIGLFCSYQILDLPSVFMCGPPVPQPNATSIAVNQTETGLQCNDLHYQEKSNLNIAIIVIKSSILMLGILEIIHLSLTRETIQEKLLGDVFDVGNNIDMENLLARNDATVNSSPALCAYTSTLKASITSQTEFQPKLLASSSISNAKTDDIFTNLLIQRGRKALSEDDRRLTRSEYLSHYGQLSGTQVKNCEEIFICTTDGEQIPKSILLTGKAGIGKSLFCQKLIRDWADNKLFQSQDVQIPDFKFAYLLTFRQLNLLGNDCVTLREILNCSSVLDDNSNIDDSLFDYILKNPEEVLIIIDGFDEYSLQDYIADNSEEQYPNNAKEKTPVAALCAKLIKGKILRGSVIMITSRPDESDKIGGIHFDQYVEITGFSSRQVKERIEKYFEANESMKNTVLDHVMKNENLVSFAHIPVLCFLMCWYMEFSLTKFKNTDDLPVSATDLYSEVVNIFELKHNAESEYKTKEIPAKHKTSNVVESTFDKLSELAAHLLLQKKPIFDERDMEEKFNSEEVEKLKASGLLHCGPPFRKSAFETTKHFSFTHLTVHEFLAARWFVTNREIPEENVSSMVVQFMAGILSKKKDDQLMEKLLGSISSSYRDQPLLLRAKCLSEYQDKEFAKTSMKNHSQHYSGQNGIRFERLTDVDCIAISFLLDVISALNEEEATMPAQHERSEQSFTVERFVTSSSNLTLSGVERICKSLEKEHCAVTKLCVVYCPLTDKCIHSISRILVSSKLKELSIHGDITDIGVASLCEALQHSNCKVTTLALSDNQITDTGVASLCNVLQHSSCKVTTLTLSDNRITDNGIASLCEALQHSCCKVNTLHLTFFSQITDTGVTSLCEALQNSNCRLTKLDLPHNQITDATVVSLCESLQNSNCKVTSLNLGDNQITDTGVASLCEALQHSNCKVTTLVLSHIHITDIGVSSLCEALQHSKCKVTTLDLKNNQITDAGVVSLCVAIQHSNCKITTLHLSHNQITDTSVASLCEALQHSNCKLTTLSLYSFNNISKKIRESLRILVQQHRPGFELDI